MNKIFKKIIIHLKILVNYNLKHLKKETILFLIYTQNKNKQIIAFLLLFKEIN